MYDEMPGHVKFVLGLLEDRIDHAATGAAEYEGDELTVEDENDESDVCH